MSLHNGHTLANLTEGLVTLVCSLLFGFVKPFFPDLTASISAFGFTFEAQYFANIVVGSLITLVVTSVTRSGAKQIKHWFTGVTRRYNVSFHISNSYKHPTSSIIALSVLAVLLFLLLTDKVTYTAEVSGTILSLLLLLYGKRQEALFRCDNQVTQEPGDEKTNQA